MPDGGFDPVRLAPAVERVNYTVKKGEVSLAVYRKRAGMGPRQVLFLVHGSSNSALSSFDLVAPGGEYSTMNVFAELGYDVWTMDHENYGRSSRTEGNSDIASGVQDLIAASDLVLREAGQKKMHMLGESSGALRAAAFAMERPALVDRLILNAFTYTGRNSPTLAKRSEQLPYFRTHNRRLRDRAMIESIFIRDHPGTSDLRVAAALADTELQFGDQVPTGTYLDMCANLPVVDPARVKCPVMLIRGEHDGIASEEDLLNFYAKLPNPDRQFVVLPGAAHALVFGHNRHQFWHVAHGFLSMPPRRDDH
jgi:alpha-beta hydrolase superfamily lysophospholipase